MIIFVGKVDQYEIDFVAKSNQGFEYYQVAATVRDESTLERELRPLKMISDNHPKYLITLDVDPEANHEGIKD